MAHAPSVVQVETGGRRRRGVDLAVALGVRAVVVLVVALVVSVFAAGIVAGAVLGAAGTPIVLIGWSEAAGAAVLSSWGLAAGSIVAYVLVLETVAFTLGLVAAWVLLRRPWSGFRVYVALVLLLHTGVGGSAPLLLAAAVPALGWVTALTGLGWFGLFSLLLVFPDGRFVPRWTRWSVPAWILVFGWFLTLEPDAAPPPGAAIGLLLLILGATAAQIYRYRRVSDATTRLRTRWVLLAFAARVGVVVGMGVISLVVPVSPTTPTALVIELTGTGVSILVSALLALAIAAATVRHRLFDVDVVISRAVLYVTLTTFVLLLYGLVVGVIGSVWPGGVVLPVIATAVAAVLLVPARTWVQRRVSRAVYGERAEPYRVVRELSDRLATTRGADEVVRTVVGRIGPTFDLGQVSVTLAGQALPVAAWAGPDQGEQIESFPIRHQGSRVGTLAVVPRWGRPLTAADRDLLAGLADQAGTAVAAAQATALLQQARDQAVAAREEERRRLHRDLHDGLGPTLAGIYQRVDLAARLVETDPDTSRELLTETGRQVKDAVADVRRVVYALRPPRLDDFGLIEAVRAGAADLSGSTMTIEVRGPEQLPQLPAVTETTAYRIALEAMTNAVRHAKATTCVVEFAVDGPDLMLTITDDGSGLPAAPAAGAGLRSLRERATEAGGRLEVETAPTGGVVVRAHLPMSPPHDRDAG